MEISLQNYIFLSSIKNSCHFLVSVVVCDEQNDPITLDRSHVDGNIVNYLKVLTARLIINRYD